MERRAVREAAEQAGAREVVLIEEVVAAAIGADLPIAEAHANFIIDIGENTAEDVKIRIGSAFPLKEEQTMEVRGRDQATGLPKAVLITSEEIRQALMENAGSTVRRPGGSWIDTGGRRVLVARFPGDHSTGNGARGNPSRRCLRQEPL